MTRDELNFRYLLDLLLDLLSCSQKGPGLLDEPLLALLKQSCPCTSDGCAWSRPSKRGGYVHAARPCSNCLEGESSQLFGPKHQAREPFGTIAILVWIAWNWSDTWHFKVIIIRYGEASLLGERQDVTSKAAVWVATYSIFLSESRNFRDRIKESESVIWSTANKTNGVWVNPSPHALNVHLEVFCQWNFPELYFEIEASLIDWAMSSNWDDNVGPGDPSEFALFSVSKHSQKDTLSATGRG